MTLLKDYRVRARNTATDSENTIHADEAARQFGFRGGLVPGVVVFGYAIKPVIDFYGREWMERGRVQIKLQQPVYEGDEVLVRTEPASPSGSLKITVSTEGEPAAACATAEATLGNDGVESPTVEDYSTKALPAEADRPWACRELLIPGTTLGTLQHRLDKTQSRVFAALDETNPIFLGSGALVHPAVLLELANRVLMRSFRLGPWLHASSTVTNWSAVRDGTDVQVKARIADCFERKGHEFVVVEMVIATEADRVTQHAIHTAIYRPKFVSREA